MAAVVGIDIEGEINGTPTVAQLSKLAGVEMGAQRAGDVVKTRLPQHGIVEQPLDENHLGALSNLLPGIQATLGAWEESMSEGGSDTAAVEVNDASALAAREDDAPVEGVAALRVEQTETPQEIERIALRREMTAQARAGGVADPLLFDRGGIVQSALPKIAQCLGVAIELLLIESGGLFEHGGRVGWRSALLLEVSKALAEGQMAGQLDKAQEIAALAAAVTVKEIFAGVDIKRRPGFRVQRTESDELGAVTGRAGGPILPLQVIKERQALFEFFNLFVHGAVLPPETSVGEGRQPFQGTRVGRKIFSETQRPKDLQSRSQPRQSFVTRLVGECQPMSDAGEGLTQKGSRWLGGIQALGPATERGGIGHPIRVFERRPCLFPGAVLHHTPPPCLTTSQ